MKGFCQRVVDGLSGSGLRLAQPVLDLGKELFYRIEIRRVLRQEELSGAGLADGGADRSGLMRAEIVRDDDVAKFELRYQHLLDIDQEAFAIDRAVDDPRCADAVDPEGCDKSHGIPVTEGRMAQQPFAARRPAPERRHIRLRPGFVDKDEARWIDAMAMLQPARPPGGNIGPLSLAGDQRLFL